MSVPAADYVAASDGTGEAVRAIVTTQRLVGATTLIVDSVENWPNKFIATSGTLDPVTGLLDDNTLTVFKGTLSGSIITIDEFAPGYADVGHSVNQIVVLKPSTLWADIVREYLDDLATFASASTQVALVRNEALGGPINGVNVTFTLVGSAVTGSVELYKNGVRQNPGVGNDYTVSGNTITMAVAPLAGTVLLADYATSTSQFTAPTTVGIRTNESVTGTINGTNKVFTTVAPYMPGTLEVWVNGLKQIPVTHYVETTPVSGIFTFDDAPLTGDNIIVNYHNSLSFAIGDADTLDTFHANPVATANSILPLNASAKYPIDVLHNPYKFSAYMSANQALAVTTWTKMQMNTENYDTNNNFDTTTYGYTVPVDGYYTFTATMLLQSQAGTTFLGSISKNGTSEFARLWEVPNTTGNLTQSGSIDLYLTAGEVIYLLGYTGTAKTVLGTMQYSRFSGRLISRT